MNMIWAARLKSCGLTVLHFLLYAIEPDPGIPSYAEEGLESLFNTPSMLLMQHNTASLGGPLEHHGDCGTVWASPSLVHGSNWHLCSAPNAVMLHWQSLGHCSVWKALHMPPVSRRVY